ncbi:MULTISPECIES: hypothetical protein [unclassified Tolypothrix]|nr:MULTISPECIES: hypothetical protein [unclassified Tolypothrix]
MTLDGLALETPRWEFKNGGMGQSKVMAIALSKSASGGITLLSIKRV